MRVSLSNLVTGAAIVAGGAVVVRQVQNFQREMRRQQSRVAVIGQPVHRIVVVGVGFGGLAAVNRLGDLVAGDPRFDVLLIDRHNFHLFWPLVYQVATGGVDPGSLAYPARTIVRDYGFRFLEADVQGVDVVQKCLDTDVGPIPYDSLILAPGSVTNFFGMPDVVEHVIPLKSLDDSTRLRNRVIECFEIADRGADPSTRQALLTFVIAGGGATGVELASSLSDMIFTALLPIYPSISETEVRLVLVETHASLLAGWNPRMGQLALDNLQRGRVEVMLNTAVARVFDDHIETSAGGCIPTATVVWTAGVRAAPLVGRLPGDKGRDGRVRVDDNLELPSHPGVFVVGDAAAFVNPGESRPLPPTARAALDAGAVAAENAVRRALGQPLKSFVYRSPGDLVSLGRGAAAANLAGLVFDGLPAWIIRRTVYLVNLIGVRNRLSVLLDWALVSFHQRVLSSYDHVAEAEPRVPAAIRREDEERRAA